MAIKIRILFIVINCRAVTSLIAYLILLRKKSINFGSKQDKYNTVLAVEYP